MKSTMKSNLLSDYLPLLANIKVRVASAHISVARTINRELIQLYWDIGQAIVEKQHTTKWGDSVVERSTWRLNPRSERNSI